MAQQVGILRDPLTMAAEPEDPPGVMLANLRIPNSSNAGIILMGQDAEGRDHVAGIDLAAAVFEGKRLRILPTEKAAVSHDGCIIGEGLVPIARDDGLIRIAGKVIDVVNQPWQIRQNKAAISVGQLANRFVYVARGLDQLDYEAQDVSVDSGIEALPRRRFY